MSIFIKRKRIKYNKRKCGKYQTAEAFIGDFEEFLKKVQFDFIQTTEDDVDDGRDPMWGRFPLDRCYNMYRVPLPFVNGQDDTLTV